MSDWQDVCSQIYARDSAHFLLVANSSKVSFKIKVGDFIDGLGGEGNEYPYVLLKDIKSSGSNGGSSSSGWNVRDLNTEEVDTDDLCSLSSNQFTLPAGDYRILVSAPAYLPNLHQIALYDADATSYKAYGAQKYDYSASYADGRSFLIGIFTLSTSTTLEIHHYISNARASDGLGVGGSVGLENTFTICQIWKVG
jgi:hypothetical protein